MSAPSLGFVKWLTRLLSDLTEDGMISRFELLHTVEGEYAERIETWRNNSDAARDPQEFAQELYDAATRDAQTRVTGQPQRYVVYAFRSDAEVHESQHAFLMKPGPTARYGDDSEPPTEKGVITHYMRHDENVHRLLMSASESLVGRLATDLDRERSARVKAEELNWSMLERYQALQDREHERRIAEAKELMKARRLDELLGVATALLPILATKLLAGPAALAPGAQPQWPAQSAPELTDPKDAAVRTFLAALTPEEVAAVLGCLSTANQMALGQLHRAFSEPPTNAADVAAKQLAMRKFLKALSEDETRAIFAALSPERREQLLVLYSHYRQIEEAEQARKPEILRS